MLSSSSGSEEITTNSNSTNTTKNRLSEWSSSSTSKSSFSSKSSPSRRTRRRTMEEVWKDINLASLHDMNITITSSDHHHQPALNPINGPPPPPPPPPNNLPPTNLHRPNNVFQDFLARPFSNNTTDHHLHNNILPYKPAMVGSTTTQLSPSSMAASPSPSPSPSPDPSSLSPSPSPSPSSLHHHHHHHHPATALSLNSGPEFRFLDDPLHHHHLHDHQHRDHHQLQNHDLLSRPHHIIANPMNVMTTINPFDHPYSSTSSSSLGKKRFPCDNITGGGGGTATGGDRRHKRMIKNRESAARSRARKQAYTNELEMEVAQLIEENERLRKQQEQLCQAAAAQFPKKNSLQRTSTAPF